jgi:hypothetical protein
MDFNNNSKIVFELFELVSKGVDPNEWK